MFKTTVYEIEIEGHTVIVDVIYDLDGSSLIFESATAQKIIPPVSNQDDDVEFRSFSEATAEVRFQKDLFEGGFDYSVDDLSIYKESRY